MRLGSDLTPVKTAVTLENSSSRASYKAVDSLPTDDVFISQTSDLEKSQSARVTISEDALRKMGLLKDESKTAVHEASDEKKDISQKSNSSTTVNSAETRRLETLKRLDRDVRAHEQAHVIAGGSLVRGAASFGYAAGPDGKLYAVNGEVSIDSSPIQDDPAATIKKMAQVVKAALAPAQPSGQDRAVASAATKNQMEAQQNLAQQQMTGEKSSSGMQKSNSSSASDKTKSDEKPRTAGALGMPDASQKAQTNDALGINTREANSKFMHIGGKNRVSDPMTLPTGKLPAKDAEPNLLPSGKLPARETDSNLLPAGKLPAKEEASKPGATEIFAAYNKIRFIKTQSGSQKQNPLQLKSVNIQA